VIVIAGATASGKTDVAERVAERLDAEVVCADSRQVFRDLEIGTGKPSPAERAARPHHLFDARSLGDRPSAGWWAREAAARVAAIHARGRVTVLVGGTGLYLRALERGLAEEPPRREDIRARLAGRLARDGAPALHAELARVDPDTAGRVQPADAQRVSRALEVWEASGRPLSWWHASRHAPGLEAEWTKFELVARAGLAAARIERRTREMWEQGLLEETRALVDRSLEPELRALRAIGYEEALDRLSGAIGEEDAVRRMNARTRGLAKRQRTWFRHQLDAHRLEAEALAPSRAVDAIVAAFGSAP